MSDSKRKQRFDWMRVVDFSDDEEVQWQDFKLSFGKHRGKTLAQMIQTTQSRDYLRYLLRWDDLRAETRRPIQAALDHYTQLRSTKSS
jgi:hypothetical protein